MMAAPLCPHCHQPMASTLKVVDPHDSTMITVTYTCMCSGALYTQNRREVRTP